MTYTALSSSQTFKLLNPHSTRARESRLLTGQGSTGWGTTFPPGRSWGQLNTDAVGTGNMPCSSRRWAAEVEMIIINSNNKSSVNINCVCIAHGLELDILSSFYLCNLLGPFQSLYFTGFRKCEPAMQLAQKIRIHMT